MMQNLLDGLELMKKVCHQMYDEHDTSLSIYPRKGYQYRPEIVTSIAPREGHHLDHKRIGHLVVEDAHFLVGSIKKTSALCPELGGVLKEYGCTWGKA